MANWDAQSHRPGYLCRARLERMFENLQAPSPALHQGVPQDWPVLLLRAAPPGPTEPYSSDRREVLVATGGGRWSKAVIWAWAWNEIGRPVRWRCQLEVEGQVGWYCHDGRLIRSTVPGH